MSWRIWVIDKRCQQNYQKSSKRTKRWISRHVGASLLGNRLTGKGFKWSNIPGQGIMWAGEGTIRACEGTFNVGQEFLVSPHLLANFEIQKYYQNEPKFEAVYSRNNLSKTKHGGICNKFWWI